MVLHCARKLFHGIFHVNAKSIDRSGDDKASPYHREDQRADDEPVHEHFSHPQDLHTLHPASLTVPLPHLGQDPL